MLKGLEVYVTRENFENMRQFAAFRYLIALCLENSLKINIFWIKNSYYSYTFAMWLVIVLEIFLGKTFLIDAF